MPDIDKINNVAVADISKLDSITFADGQKVNNQDVSLVTDARVLIEAQTFTDESTVSFDSRGGSSYMAHLFQFINIHSDNNDVQFRFASNVSDDHQWANFVEIKHNEPGTDDTSWAYDDSHDVLLNASTKEANLAAGLGSVATESLSGYLYIYGLNNTPLQHGKQWYSRTSHHSEDDYNVFTINQGIIVHDGSNGNDAISQIDFTMSGGTFDGTIRCFGMALA